MKGVFGKFTDINLNDMKIKDYYIPSDWYDKYLGGKGIAARILLKELNPNIDPLSADNIIVITIGPLGGLGVAGSSRVLFMAKSPKTNTLNDSYAGGKFGDVLGKSGYDGIIIRGKSNKPVYIMIDNGKVQILPAGKLWGLDPLELEDILDGKHRNTSIACIGKAGENQVIQSCVMIDKNRAIGRPGYGAVLGSKNLKAVVVKGDLKKEVANPEEFINLKKEYAKKLMNPDNAFIQRIKESGTAGATILNSEIGNLPTKNFQNGQYFLANDITGQTMIKSKIWVKRDSCPGCPIGCKRVVKGTFNNQKFEPEWGGPEYETLAAFGSMLLIDNLEAISLFNKKCNKYGLDTISVGVHAAYLMEATEKGLLKDENGIKWGDAKAVDELIEKIVQRKEIGEWIARGVGYITEKIGDDSFFVHSKGQETPMHDPRVKYSMAVYYSSSYRGANHMNGIHDPTPPHEELDLPDNPRDSWDERAKIAGQYLFARSFTNSLILCALSSGLVDGSFYLLPIMRKITKAATGKNIDVEEMLKIGERNEGLLRIFAEKVGYTRKDDKLPKRLYEAQASTGYNIDKKMLDYTIDEYYKLYGYGKYGPTKEKIESLGMSDIN